MSAESQAAVTYWSGWESEPVRFARRDLGTVPVHWSFVGTRRSALTTTSPRLATTPAQAVINYAAGLAEFACTIGLRAAGLDPDLGWLHRDAPYRAPAALDVQEAIRPVADAFVLDLIRTRTFSRREFGELPSGQVRLSSSLARPLAQAALPMLESSVQPVVEEVVRILAASSVSPIRIRKRRAPVKIGRVQPRPLSEQNTKRIASACRIRGLVLDDHDRAVCDQCWPEYERARTDKLSTVGKATLVAMRAWERQHGRGDPEVYEREIRPVIQRMTVPQLMKLTGLSQFHCWKVRKGDRRLHARHWNAIRESEQTSSSS